MNGKLTISRVRGANGYVSISLIDALSGCEAIDVQITPENFAEALLGLGHTECAFWINQSGVIGNRRELRSITLPLPPTFHPRTEVDARKWIEDHAASNWLTGGNRRCTPKR